MMREHQLFLVCLAVAGHTRLADATLLEPTIGESFFLPEVEIGSRLLGGRRILKDVERDCYTSHKTQGPTGERRLHFESTNSFYSSLSTDYGIKETLQGKYTMGTTLSNRTNSLSGGQVEIKGTAIDIYSYVNMTLVEATCYQGHKTQLEDSLVSHLDSLPSDVKDPHKESSWSQYHNFLRTFGSHFVSKVYYGARVKQWTFSKKEKNYSDRQLKERACADLLGGTNVGATTVETCAGISNSEATSALQLEMTSDLEILGGSDATRNQLRSQRTEELINKLLNEGREMQTLVDYQFMEIWDILKMKFYNNPRRLAKAENLQKYYEGYLDFGCTLIESGSLKLRRFERSAYYTDTHPDYECVLEKEGCHNNDDCTVGGAGSVTYCYGKSCVEYTSPTDGSKAKGAKIRWNKTGSYSSGVNKSCYYSWARGKCHGDWSRNKIIWPASRAKRAFTEKIRATRSGKNFAQ